MVYCTPKIQPGIKNKTNQSNTIYLQTYSFGIAQNSQLVILYHLRDDKSGSDVLAYSIIF